jgi:hypothetical protein
MVGDTFQYVIKEVVDSIDTIVLLTGEVRKRLKLRCIYDDPETAIHTEWVEGIGNINGLFAVNSMTNCIADGEGSDIMCMYRNDTLIYDDPEIDSCWLLPTATLTTNKESIIFAPNPASDFISILGVDQEIKYINVFNVVGNCVYRGKKDRIDVNDLPPGYYFLELMLKDNHILTKGFIRL